MTKPSGRTNRVIAPAEGPAGRPTRALRPPRRVWITLVSLAAATLMVRANLLEPLVGSVVDQAVRNIITLILCFSGLVVLLLWFLWESGHPPRLKKIVAACLVGAVASAVAVLRIERVSGDLVPEFAFRWSPSRDRLLPRPVTADGSETPGSKISGSKISGSALSGSATSGSTASEAAPWTATSTDFPGFLGPSGTCSLDGTLDPDWSARPPRLLWRRPLGAGWSGFATCGEHAVTLEQRGDDEVVSCCSLATGQQEWAVAVPGRHETVLGGVGPRSTPTIRDGAVYTHGAGGWLHAIDGASGRVLWKKNVLDELGIDAAAHAALVTWGRAGSPLVTADLVIVPAGGPRTRRAAADPEFLALVAFDRATGERRWTAGDEQISYVTPRVVEFGGRPQVLSVNEAHIAAYDPADGRALWEVAWPGHSNSDASCSQPVPLDDRTFIVSKGYGIGAAVFEIARHDAEPWTLREAWRAPGLLKTKFTNVAIHGGHAYGLSDGILECVRVSDGARRWKGGRYGQGQLLRVGELLLVQAESGDVVLVDATPAAHRVRGRLAAIAGQTWNNPCLAGDRLLVRNAEEAACYRVPLGAVTAPVADAAP